MPKDKKFLTLVKNNPLGAAYQIVEKKNQLQYLKKEQIQEVWAKIAEAIASGLVMDENKEILFTGIRELLQDPHCLQTIEEEALLNLGCKFELYRDILIALLRKNNPTVFSEFSYQLIHTGGVEQNFLYLGRFIQRCDLFPIQSIVSLGSKNLQIATLILKDIGSHPDYFEISMAFLSHHPCLAEKIALNWSHLVQLYPLKQVSIKKMLASLQSEYPAFNKVKLDARIQHDHFIRQDLPQSNIGRVVNVAGLVFLACVAPRIIKNVIKVGSIVAAALGSGGSASLFVPAFLIYGAYVASTRIQGYLEKTPIYRNRSRPDHR